jgi:hypothetical protein
MTVRSASLETKGSSLYLGVELRVGDRKLEAGDILEAAGEDGSEPSAAPPFAEHTGFYLCTSEDASLLAAVAEDLTPPPCLDFHPLGIALLTMRYPSGVPWWRNLSWEMEPLQKIRKQRSGSRRSGSRRSDGKSL